MLRLFVVAAVLACCSGCGQSFVEAEAIWKDEVAKLEAMEAEWKQARMDVFDDPVYQDAVAQAVDKWGKEHGNAITFEQTQATSKFVDDCAKPYLDALKERYKPIVDQQKKKVDEAFAAKEAAKH